MTGEGRRLARWRGPFLALVFLAGALAVGQRASEQVRAQKILFGARTLVEAGGTAPPALRERALDLLREASSARPWDVRFEASRGDLFMLLGRPHAAVRSYRSALELEPRPEVQANLGLALLELEEREEAYDLFREAILVDPSLRRRLISVAPDLGSRRREPGASKGSARREGKPPRRGELGVGEGNGPKEPASNGTALRATPRSEEVFSDGFEGGNASAWAPGDAREPR